MAETIVRLYDDISEAYRVVDELVQAGYNRDDITLMAYDPEGTYADYVDVDYEQAREVGEEAAVGAGVGAIIGGLGGLLIGLGALTIPGLGPIIAAGPIAAALIGAGTGATVGGLVGALVETGLPEETAQYYAEGVRRGGTLVILQARNDLAQRAEEIMDQYGAVDMDERTASWRARGWQGYDAQAEPYAADEIEYEADYYNTYDPTFRQHYQTNYSTSGYPYARYEPAYRYGYDLAYDERYLERDWDEIEPEARRDWEREHPDSLWEDVKDAARNAWEEVQNAFDFDDEEDYQTYDETFRTHYNDTYRTTGRDYDSYQPAYRYGYNLAYDERYMDRDWDEIEPEARRDWEREHPDSLWENVKDAIENAWNEVQNTFDFEEDYQGYDEGFRTHYTQTYGTTGRAWGDYEPAYRYGHSLAYDERYVERDWTEIEPDARREWETEYGQGTWENVKDAVQNAWNGVQNALDLNDEPDVNIDYDNQEYEDYDYYQGRFRGHYDTTYGTTGYNYDYYEPAYRYGYDLATSDRYGRRDWGEIETEARDLWEGRNEGTWDRFKDAVKHAWHEVKETLGMEEDRPRRTTQPRQYS
jgi:hypothetical protein